MEKSKNGIDKSRLYAMTESTCDQDPCDTEAMTAPHKIVDDHDAEKTKTVRMKLAMHWHNDVVKGLIRERRKAQRW